MITSNNLSPGLIISLSGKLYRVESSIKVNVPKGSPFIKTKLKDLITQEIIEKSFKLNQNIENVMLIEKRLEFLYLEGKDYLFLDIGNLEQILIPQSIIGNRVEYLKEGVELKASFYGDTIFAVELPQFLELMVAKTQGSEQRAAISGGTKIAVLETGAKVEVPPFIEAGDIIKVDTKTDEYIQRV